MVGWLLFSFDLPVGAGTPPILEVALAIKDIASRTLPLLFLPLILLIVTIHFILHRILGEVRIRSIRIVIGIGLTWFTCYWLPKELIFLLAKPFISLSFDSYFVCTQLTEALSTHWYLCYFCSPSYTKNILYQE